MDVCREEHVICLDYRSDEEAGEGNDCQAEPSRQGRCNECLIIPSAKCQYPPHVSEPTNVGIVVLAQDIKDPTVECRFDLVKLCHVGMLDVVHKQFASDDDKKWREHLAGEQPGGKDGKAVR